MPGRNIDDKETENDWKLCSSGTTWGHCNIELENHRTNRWHYYWHMEFLVFNGQYVVLKLSKDAWMQHCSNNMENGLPAKIMMRMRIPSLVNILKKRRNSVRLVVWPMRMNQFSCCEPCRGGEQPAGMQSRHLWAVWMLLLRPSLSRCKKNLISIGIWNSLCLTWCFPTALARTSHLCAPGAIISWKWCLELQYTIWTHGWRKWWCWRPKWSFRSLSCSFKFIAFCATYFKHATDSSVLCREISGTNTRRLSPLSSAWLLCGLWTGKR